MALKISKKGSISPAPLGFGPPPVTPGKEFGRISGPLLSDNLLRNNQNLAFDTDSLYLNVNSSFVGINTAAPVRNLNINGKTFTTDLIVDTQADIAHLTFDTNTIQNIYNENIVFQPFNNGDPTIVVNGIGTTDHLTFIRNELYAEIDTDIVLDPTGLTNINSSAFIDGNLHATGAITFDGNITFGNEASDSINLAADIGTSIIPVLDGVYNIGGPLHLRVPNDSGFSTTTSLDYFYATKASWEQSSAQVGFEITDVKFAPGTTISNVEGPLNDLGYDFYIIYTSTNQLVDILQNSQVDIDSKNWLGFYSNNFNATTILATNANLDTLTAGNVRFNNHSISNILINTDLNITTQTTGTVRFNEFLKIDTGSLVSHTDNAILTFDSLIAGPGGAVTGYVKFAGSNGVTVPAGTTFERPVSPELGTMRYNSTLNYVEVYANVSNTSTISLVTTSADAFIGDNIIYTTNTTNFVAGDFVSSTSVPGAFASGTIIIDVVDNINITVSNTLLANLPSGSNLTVQRKWIPIIGTSPVLSESDVTDTMDLWSLILG